MEKLIKEAQAALAAYDALNESKRYYENESWHAVNVKRYNDQIDIIDIVANPLKYQRYFDNSDTQPRQLERYKSEILNYFTDEKISHFYDAWLELQRVQLDYEISDFDEVLEGQARLTKIDKAPQWSNRSNIVFLGRSGGWACFQDTAENDAEELATFLAEAERDERNVNDYDLIALTASLNHTVKEVEAVKIFIKAYNENLNFLYEVFYRLAEFCDELDEQATIKAINPQLFASDIKSLAEQIETRCNQFKADPTLANNIKRNALSILKLIKK